MDSLLSDGCTPGAERSTTETVTLASIVRYAGASGDFTPFHWDLDAARAAGYDELFAMGMLGAGKLSSLLVEWFGPAAIQRFKVRFGEPAIVGHEVTYRATVASVEDGVARMELLASDADGKVLIQGEADLQLQAA